MAVHLSELALDDQFVGVALRGGIDDDSDLGLVKSHSQKADGRCDVDVLGELLYGLPGGSGEYDGGFGDGVDIDSLFLNEFDTAEGLGSFLCDEFDLIELIDACSPESIGTCECTGGDEDLCIGLSGLFEHHLPILIIHECSDGEDHDVHSAADGLVDDLGLPRLEKMLKKHPDLIILGHSQPFWAEMSELTEADRNGYPTGKVKEGRLPKLLREYGNLHCDLSAGSGANALMRDREYAARFIEEFADRLYYGCDICAASNTHPFPFNDFLDDMRATGEISEENYRKIVRENAVRLLEL